VFAALDESDCLAVLSLPLPPAHGNACVGFMTFIGDALSSQQALETGSDEKN
jgi:hypothetical protein